MMRLGHEGKRAGHKAGPRMSEDI
ncbi:hypothetical protein SIAM614_04510 [Roseibium aggregatum IAM 12614]|uniref:Uncharacterized protein n=1 Tax=Roseibium aggregatum (strain ATCC 25650 / DSM 13394 / JCM 20685 / NBRC 16684 / NCIMB 2208 / IAM 12614 / B1) TaxID=384765 RepID=A0NS65_ROSAI|nr:hypothetical protein SIAM614_04510 [Roseibium aggregatum IAM 12614]